MKSLITQLLSCNTCIEAKTSHTGGIPYVSTMGHLTTIRCSTLLIRIRLQQGPILPYVKALRPSSWFNSIKKLKNSAPFLLSFARATSHVEVKTILCKVDCYEFLRCSMHRGPKESIDYFKINKI